MSRLCIGLFVSKIPCLEFCKSLIYTEVFCKASRMFLFKTPCPFEECSSIYSLDSSTVCDPISSIGWLTSLGRLYIDEWIHFRLILQYFTISKDFHLYTRCVFRSLINRNSWLDYTVAGDPRSKWEDGSHLRITCEYGLPVGRLPGPYLRPSTASAIGHR